MCPMACSGRSQTIARARSRWSMTRLAASASRIGGQPGPRKIRPAAPVSVCDRLVPLAEISVGHVLAQRSRHPRSGPDPRRPRLSPAAGHLDHATITLLVAEETVIDQWDLAWTGRGKVKQTFHNNPAGTGRRMRKTR